MIPVRYNFFMFRMNLIKMERDGTDCGDGRVAPRPLQEAGGVGIQRVFVAVRDN